MAVVSNGTTIIDAGALGASAGAGKLTLIKTLTASSSSTLSFVHGASSVVFDGTYDSYIFKFISIHPASDNVSFQFNLSTDSGSNYNVTKTSSAFHAFNGGYGNETLAYYAASDLNQSTGFQTLSAFNIWNDAKAGLSSTMSLFNPSSTTFVKHFIIRSSSISNGGSYTDDTLISGYGNTTSAINAVQFKMSSGNIDAGTIKLYGVG